MQQVMTILEFNNVSKYYENSVCALDGLTMVVPGGSIFGFIGLNGAGKTTTIRILAGLSKSDGGTITLFGNELRSADVSYKREVGFVLDEPLYFDWMSVQEYLTFVGTMYGLSPADVSGRTEELLTFFDLGEKADAPIETFSTGMKKKVSLAAAIIHKPKLIALDEPLEGIDAVAASSIKETLGLMASKGTTILITSHVLDTVEKFCTDIAVIHKGAIILECKTSEIRTRAKGAMSNRTFESLEELFVELVSEKQHKKHLSWL